MSSGRRFESLTDEDLEKLIESKDSNNTKQVVKTSVRLLEEYINGIVRAWQVKHKSFRKYFRPIK
jgi:hypothetical protein